MILTILINSISAFLFLYFLWRKLKEDYISSTVFSLGFFVIFGILVANLFIFRFGPELWFWASFVGAALGILLSVYKYKLSLYETVDSCVLSLLPWISIFLLDSYAAIRKTSTLIAFVVVILHIGLYYLFDKQYKRFSWYRSGRVGFSGFAVAGVFFLVRASVAVMQLDVISFTGNIDAIVSAVVAFLFFIGLYNLSRKKV